MPDYDMMHRKLTVFDPNRKKVVTLEGPALNGIWPKQFDLIHRDHKKGMVKVVHELLIERPTGGFAYDSPYEPNRTEHISSIQIRTSLRKNNVTNEVEAPLVLDHLIEGLTRHRGLSDQTGSLLFHLATADPKAPDWKSLNHLTRRGIVQASAAPDKEELKSELRERGHLEDHEAEGLAQHIMSKTLEGIPWDRLDSITLDMVVLHLVSRMRASSVKKAIEKNAPDLLSEEPELKAVLDAVIGLPGAASAAS